MHTGDGITMSRAWCKGSIVGTTLYGICCDCRDQLLFWYLGALFCCCEIFTIPCANCIINCTKLQTVWHYILEYTFQCVGDELYYKIWQETFFWKAITFFSWFRIFETFLRLYTFWHCLWIKFEIPMNCQRLVSPAWMMKN